MHFQGRQLYIKLFSSLLKEVFYNKSKEVGPLGKLGANSFLAFYMQENKQEVAKVVSSVKNDGKSIKCIILEKVKLFSLFL